MVYVLVLNYIVIVIKLLISFQRKLVHVCTTCVRQTVRYDSAVVYLLTLIMPNIYIKLFLTTFIKSPVFL